MSGENKTISPMKYLRDALNAQVYVRLKDGSEFVGILKMTDSTMNLILEDSIEVKDGKQVVAKIGKILIRGSMIQYISFTPEIAAGEAIGK
ncbi:small nuclear ribonucleoprotein [Caldisphaera lagunensis DSM 15908]|uniref:Small nuclear ribonucleoprotein n=1 Tax=Caldisphaera lagunensis (strain DSM 15908 / JCM 11604 / ANMR 0165 / IC-154) TaxID=1056495 RepID=L0AA67_CALLD|nr:U6 snRNA-associated Sm-like protein LSm6 [Caldisphaera lagunensis]AFZ70756.1 small nuclear ribonucleoprotein [Caldisphaera lagunensis DSM 15908]